MNICTDCGRKTRYRNADYKCYDCSNEALMESSNDEGKQKALGRSAERGISYEKEKCRVV